MFVFDGRQDILTNIELGARENAVLRQLFDVVGAFLGGGALRNTLAFVGLSVILSPLIGAVDGGP
jgi:hypothetical protein